MQTQRGQFITFEGMDGAGKSTHIQWLKAWLMARGIPHLFTREPGGTPLGEKLRALLLTDTMDRETETLLMFAARKAHLEEVILPHLKQGIWVISDRFTDATYAYQGGGRNVAWERIATLETWVQGDLQPDLTVLFDISAEVSAARLASAREPDRFEQEKREFFQRVRAGYAKRLAQAPQRIISIDAARDIETIHTELHALFTHHLAKVGIAS
jgi:dTMP kinase